MVPRQRSIAERLARRIDYPCVPLGAVPALGEVGGVPVSGDLLGVPEIRHPWIIERRRGPGEPEIRRQGVEPDRVDLDLFLLMLLEHLCAHPTGARNAHWSSRGKQEHDPSDSIVMVDHGPQLVEIAEVAQLGRMCMTSGEHGNTEQDHPRENQYASHLPSPHAALSNRHVAPCGTMCPTPGVGKCAGITSTSLPACASRNFRRVAIASFRSTVGMLSHWSSAHCTGWCIRSPARMALRPAE